MDAARSDRTSRTERARTLGDLVPSLPWWASAAFGTIVITVVSALRLGGLGATPRDHAAWYTTASGHRIENLIIDQVQYLQLTDHFSGRGIAPTVAPFTTRSLTPWLAGQLGGDAAVGIWFVNMVCLALGTFALARLAMDVTRRANWTLVAVTVWAVSFPVLWYTSKAMVDASAVGLMVVALLALYRRWLLPGLIALVLAIWAKETAAILVPVAIARELLSAPRTDGRPDRSSWLRAGAWVAAAGVAYLSAGLLADGHDVTFAPWLPSSFGNAARFVGMNLGPTALPQFLFTAAPALLALLLWWRARRSSKPFLDDADAWPMVVGIVASLALSCWAIANALWDGRTVWMSLPFAALMLAAWGARTEPALAPRSWLPRFRTVVFVGIASFALFVAWIVAGVTVNAWLVSDTPQRLQDIEPRFAAPELVQPPQGPTEFDGTGPGAIPVDGTGPLLVSFSSEAPATFSSGDQPLLRWPATSGRVLVEPEGESEIAIDTTGGWEAEVLPIDRAVFWEGLSPMSGSGPDVLLFSGGLANSLEVEVGGSPERIELTPVGQCRSAECEPLTITDGVTQVPAGTEALIVDAPDGWDLVPVALSSTDDAVTLDGTVHG